MTQTKLISIDFHGHALATCEYNGEIHFAVRPICEAIGLDWKAQYGRIKRNQILATCVVMLTTQLPGDSQHREVVTLPLKFLNGWLFGIEVGRVKPELRESILLYQRECYDVLHSYWNQGEAGNPRQYAAGAGDTLSKMQADTLRSMIDDAAKKLPAESRADFTIQAWSKLKAHFQVGYRQIPQARFGEAVALLARHIGESLPGQQLPEAVSKAIDTHALAMALQTAERIRTALKERVLNCLANGDSAEQVIQRIQNADTRFTGLHMVEAHQLYDIMSSVSQLPSLVHGILNDIRYLSGQVDGINDSVSAFEEDTGASWKPHRLN